MAHQLLGRAADERETVQSYWLYRAAELTLALGFEGLEVMAPMLGANPDAAWFAPFRVAASFVYIPIVVPDAPPPLRMEGDIAPLHRLFTPQALHVFEAAKIQAALKPVLFGKRRDSGNVCAHYHIYLYQP